MGWRGTRWLITAKQLANVICVGKKGMFLEHVLCPLQLESGP